MANPLSSLPALCKNSMTTITFSTFSSAHHLRMPLFFLLLALFSTWYSATAAEISYADHCSSIVPESIATGLYVDPTFSISNGFFSGGGNLFRLEHGSNYPSPLFQFQSKYLHKTQSPGILQVEGTLAFYFSSQAPVTFRSFGFWSESTGKLCMISHGVFQQDPQYLGEPLSLSSVLKFSYPKTSNISTSLVTGTLESLDPADSPNHFDPISLLAYTQRNNYDFTIIPQAKSSCSSLKPEEELLSFDLSSTCYFLLSYISGRMFKVNYKAGCTSSRCETLGRSLGFSFSFMSFSMIQCSNHDGRLHLSIKFSNISRYDNNLMSEKSLVGEGYWDHNNSQLCLLACRILKGNSPAIYSVDDCAIGLRLWFPAAMTLKRRSNVVGRIWSNKNKDDAGYFSMLSFQSLCSPTNMEPALKYKYTEIDSIWNSCSVSTGTKLGKRRYPNGKSAGDMLFHISLKDARGREGQGRAMALSIGETYYGVDDRAIALARSSASSAHLVEIDHDHSILNVSYVIPYNFFDNSSTEYELSVMAAEGIYDAGSGTLCMKGCRCQSSPLVKDQIADLDSDSRDCEILIHIHLRPLNPEAGDHINGTISSTRNKLDSLYFDPIEVSSDHMYINEATITIWRMDVEILMVLISLTFSCICIRLQILHVKKHPADALPSISISMLFILMLGYMIPLVLNFEALFIKQQQHNVLLRGGGRLEVNEVIARIITIIAVFLSFRLLQVAWSARSLEERKGHRAAERTALMLCLPLYFAGGLLIWLVHSRTYEAQLRRQDKLGSQQRHFILDYLSSYAGLVLDGFLLPQIILNICHNSKDKVLTPFFYVGITITRALPHLYDAYRTRWCVPHLISSYIYASPVGNFYSSAWDIIIPCGGFLFAVLIYMQQRHGGGCILPKRFRKFDLALSE